MEGKKFSFRSAIDLTPNDKNGYSFWGLKRNQAKWLGFAFIITAIAMMLPFFPDPSDVLNIMTATFLMTHFGIAANNALLISYTLLPWALFIIGLYIFPYNTRSLFNGYITKFKKIISKYSKKPLVLIALVIIGYYTLNWYKEVLFTLTGGI